MLRRRPLWLPEPESRASSLITLRLLVRLPFLRSYLAYRRGASRIGWRRSLRLFKVKYASAIAPVRGGLHSCPRIPCRRR